MSDLTQTVETSPELKDLFAALAKAQGEMRPAPKNSLNPAFARGNSKGSKYADLADCMEAIRPPLSKHGLSLLQLYAGAQIVTILAHESGQWIRGRVTIPNFDQLTPQQIGSATTYLRRYSLGIVGLVTDEDDDGNAASVTVDPRGEDYKKVDTRTLNKYVAALQEHFARDPIDELGIREILDEIAGDNEMKIAIWSKLQNWQKDFIKSLKSTKEAA